MPVNPGNPLVMRVSQWSHIEATASHILILLRSRSVLLSGSVITEWSMSAPSHRRCSVQRTAVTRGASYGPCENCLLRPHGVFRRVPIPVMCAGSRLTHWYPDAFLLLLRPVPWCAAWMVDRPGKTVFPTGLLTLTRCGCIHRHPVVCIRQRVMVFARLGVVITRATMGVRVGSVPMRACAIITSGGWL